MSDLIKHARAIADDSMGMEVGDRECVAQLIDRIAELESELKRARKLLCVAHCPNCAGEGMYCAEVPGYDGEPDYDMVECEFCAERKALLGETE